MGYFFADSNVMVGINYDGYIVVLVLPFPLSKTSCPIIPVVNLSSGWSLFQYEAAGSYKSCSSMLCYSKWNR